MADKQYQLDAETYVNETAEKEHQATTDTYVNETSAAAAGTTIPIFEKHYRGMRA